MVSLPAVRRRSVVGLLGTGFPLETFRAPQGRKGGVPVHEYGHGCESWLAADAQRIPQEALMRRWTRLTFLRAAVAKFAAMLF